MMPARKLSAILLLVLFVSACQTTEEIPWETPATYEFLRNGQSTVSYSGQTDRLDHLTAMKSLMNQANGGAAIDGSDLTDMYANTGGDGGGNFTFTSSKQLRDKTASGEALVLDGLMTSMGTSSQTGGTASNGQSGLLVREGSGSTILVNDKGQEYTQMIEKGIMGATFYYQITSVYLSDERVGNSVNNTDIVEGANHTAMEHHWDEAFGYLGVPVDFRSDWPSDRNGETRFLGSYIRGRDALLGSGDILMEAFKRGREAIVRKDYDERDAQRDIIYFELEKVFAATAIHYINAALASLDDDGEFFHTLTECYAFIKGLNFSPRATLSEGEITALLISISDASFNLWNASQSGLNNAKDSLSDAFGFNSIKDAL